MSMVRKKYMSKNESDRLKRIIEAARQLIETAGIEGLTMRSLAAEARVSPVTLYNRFGNKDNIVSLVIIDNFEIYVDTHRPTANGTASPLDSFLDLLKVERGTIKSQGEMSKALVTMYFKPGNDRELPNHLRGMLRDRFVPILDEMRRKKLIAADTNIDLLGLDIADRFLAVAMRWFQADFKEKELLDRICYSVLLALAGFSTGSQLKRIHSLIGKITLRIRA